MLSLWPLQSSVRKHYIGVNYNVAGYSFWILDIDIRYSIFNRLPDPDILFDLLYTWRGLWKPHRGNTNHLQAKNGLQGRQRPNREQKYGKNMVNRFPDHDFIFHLLYIRGSISNRLGSAKGRWSAIRYFETNATQHVCDDTGNTNIAVWEPLSIIWRDGIPVYGF